MARFPLACRCLATAVLVALGAGAAGAAPSADEIRRVAAEVLADGDYQRELPEPVRTKAVEPGSATPKRSDPEPRPERPLPEAPGATEPNVGVWLGWVLGIAAAALLAFYGLHRLPFLIGRRDGAERQPAGGPAAATSAAPAASDPLAGPDGLAGEGEYGRAIHAILLLVLERLRGRLGFAPRPSSTSREIMARASLAEGASAALSLIVHLAELSHFGGRAPSEADYRSCRESYHRLVSPAVGEG